MFRSALCACFALALLSTHAKAQQSVIAAITIDPPQVALRGPRATYSLLVQGKTADGQLVDLTRSAKYQALQPGFVSISPAGVLRALKDGTTEITVEANGKTQRCKVVVEETSKPRAFHFENDIVPILSRYACNSGGCHASAEGQNGFKLSVFGSDPVFDFNALTKEARGRRIVHAAPERSLLLAKTAGLIAHGGGIRTPVDSPEYELLRGWIAAGTPFGDPQAPHVVSIRVEPRERVMAMRSQQQLRVIARFSDDRETDVTALARFQTNQEGIASVGYDGLVSVAAVPGEVAVMASYLGAVDVFRALVPRAEKIAAFPQFPENNFIDKHIIAKLKKLNITPSDLADDAEYLRRVYLDVIGTLPTPAEARRFFADTRANKRALLVDELLERSEYAEFWSLLWADVLRVDRQALGHKRAYAYYRWIRDSFARNKPMDQFARELLLAEGPLEESGPTSFYKVVSKPGDTAGTLAQIFLGVRIACAECHHHPFDRWSQTDYYGMQAFFTQLSVKGTGRGESLQIAGDPETKHPRTGETVTPHALGAPMPAKAPIGDRRVVLAEWMTRSDNTLFARNLANRAWAHLLGRGLIDPVDDVRDTNPPSNPDLLDALGKHVVETKYDLKQLIRTITASRTYQLSSRPNATNEKDALNHSRALFRRVPAEVLLDMVSQTTGIDEKFAGAAPGTRAIQLWDSKTPHYFLKLFGRPQRNSACECERIHEPSVAQVLHLLNAHDLQAKLSHERGNVAKLVQAKTKDADLVDELYLTFYSRFPRERERAASLEHLRRGSDRRLAAEDLAWTLMNTIEFLFNR